LTSLGSWVWPVLLSPFIGSFLGVIVARAESPRGIVFGRSACARCGARIGARDLIPVASWLFLRGRCRSCALPIGLFHPVIELCALGIALWSASLFSGGLLWASCFLGWTLLALAATDWKYFLLPDFLTLALIPSGLLAVWMLNPQALLANCTGAAAGYGFVIVLRHLYGRVRGREGMGLGDAKLLAASGAWVSWSGLPTVIFLGALTGLAFALLQRMRGGTLSLTNRVPFGTFLCLGTWIVWLYGPLTAG
jgi:leader peptidase (prepilin peptidase)/N-methyltransferase